MRVMVVLRGENETGHLLVSVCGGADKIHDQNFTAVFKVSREWRESSKCMLESSRFFFPSFSPSCFSFTAGQTCTLHIARLSIFRRKKIFGTGSSDTQTCSLVMRVLSSLSSCFLESPPVSPDLSVTQIRHSLDLSIVYK